MGGLNTEQSLQTGKFVTPSSDAPSSTIKYRTFFFSNQMPMEPSLEELSVYYTLCLLS